MSTTNDDTGEFLKRFPGPFAYQPGSCGVDETFDLICESTQQFIIATHFWNERITSELITKVVCAALANVQGSNGDNTDASLSDLEEAAFLGMYPGPFTYGSFRHDFEGEGWEVLCHATGKSLIHAHGDDTRFIAVHIADALNRTLYAKRTPGSPVNPAMAIHIHQIIEYLWNDEQSHFEQCEDDERRSHIFHSLLKLRKWLGNSGKKQGEPS